MVKNLPDPYSIKQKEWTDDVKLWPKHRHCIHINFFHSGHVRTDCMHRFDQSICHSNGQSEPSQRAPVNPHKAWVIVKKRKMVLYIVVGYCSCMANMCILLSYTRLLGVLVGY